MKLLKRLPTRTLSVLIPLLLKVTSAQEAPRLEPIQLLSNREAVLKLTGPAGQGVRIEASTDLLDWTGLVTFINSSSSRQTDSAAPFLPGRFYRSSMATETNLVTGDHFETTAGELTVHPVNHAAVVITWNDKTIYCDPVGGGSRFQGLPRADVTLITHTHSDHYEAGTISAVKASNGVVLAPLAVYNLLPTSLKAVATVLTNSASTNLLGFSVEAVPAYNLTSTFHPKGVGNGYVVTIAGKRIYVSGDTEDIPEMRQLPEIDVAFVCMNLPYTMSVEKAASAVREFRPKVVYIYHYRDYTSAQLNQFKQLVGTDRGIEVRLRNWY